MSEPVTRLVLVALEKRGKSDRAITRLVLVAFAKRRERERASHTILFGGLRKNAGKCERVIHTIGFGLTSDWMTNGGSILSQSQRSSAKLIKC